MPVFSQDKEMHLLTKKANEMVYSNPAEALNIIRYLSKKAETPNDKTRLNILMADAYYTKGEYDEAIEYIFETESDFNKVKDSLKTEILFRKLYMSGNLGLYSQFNGYFKLIEDIIPKLANEEAGLVKIRLELEDVYIKAGRGNYNAALKHLDSIESSSLKVIIDKDYELSQSFNIAKGVVLSGLKNYSVAETVFNIALNNYNEKKEPNIILNSAILRGLAAIYFQQKEYEKAIDALSTTLKEAIRAENIFLQEKINSQLAVNYMALNNKEEHQKYSSQFMFLNVRVNDSEILAFNTFYNLIGSEQETQYRLTENRFRLYTYITGAVLFLLIVMGNMLYFLNKSKRKQLKEIIGYLEIPNKVLVKSYPEKTETVKKLTISTETEQAILNKLKKFENSTKYTSKDMSLSTLSAQLDVNTKYLSEVINKHYNDNFNTYINKLRINYIIEKLKNEPEYLNYKISYLADESGFSSHSSFATIFKSITGIAPTVFIELLGKEIKHKKA